MKTKGRRKVARNNQIIRQWKLLQALESNRFGLTLDELAVQLVVTPMTVRRDLTALLDAGFPIFDEIVEAGHKRWRISFDIIHAPHITFTPTEVLALYLSRELLRPLAGTQFADGIRTCIDKARSMFKTTALAYFQRLADVLYVHLPQLTDYSAMEEIIDSCSVACEDERALSISYQSPGSEARQWLLNPYGLVYFHNSLYLVGHVPEVDDLRTFKIDRMQSADVMEDKFQRPEEFDLARLYEHSFGIFRSSSSVRVRLRISAAAASSVIEKRWHLSQKVEPQIDGSVIVNYVLGDTTELKSWALSFGRHVEVLSPASLRHEIAAELAEMFKQYQ